MKTVKTVAAVLIICLAYSSCGKKQEEAGSETSAQKSIPAVESPAEPVAEPETNAVTEPWPEENNTQPETSSPYTQEDLSDVKEPPVYPPAEKLSKASTSRDNTGITTQTPARTLGESFLAVMVDKESGLDPVVKPLHELVIVPEQVTVPEPVTASAGTGAALPVIIETDSPEIMLVNPEFTSFYEEQVEVRGYFSGFSNIESAGWELAGTEQKGELPKINNEFFSFTIDTTGLTDTLAVRIKAASSSGNTAEALRILLNDNTGPGINITQPANNSLLSEAEYIRGKSGKSSEIHAEIIGSSITYPVSQGPDGSFTIDTVDMINSSGFSGADDEDIIVKLTADDFNGNSSTEFLALKQKNQTNAIIIKSPADADFFGDEITVSGTVNGISGLDWDIPGTGLSGTVPLADQAFELPLRLSGLGDRMILRFSGKVSGAAVSTTIRLTNMGKTPAVAVASPVYDQFYKDSVTLSGDVGGNEGASIDSIKSLYWGIPGTENTGNLLFFDVDGKFNLDIYTGNYSGVLPLEITVEDYNSNISSQILKLLDGKALPSIKLAMPSSGSEYGAFIDIAGKIFDPYSGTPYGGIREALYEIVSTENYKSEPLKGAIELSDDYGFILQIPAIELDGDQQIILTATASNDNFSEQIIPVRKSEYDITSFSLSAVDGTITADWNPIQSESSYTLQLTDDGSEPSEGNPVLFENAYPPFSISGLENGKLYKARILAETVYGTLSSSTQSAIPVSPATFSLSASGEFKKIKLDWKDLIGSDTFTIYRSENKNTDYQLLKSSISKSEYTDRDIMYGKNYYYYVTPDNYEYAKSGIAASSMQQAPKERLQMLNSISSFTASDINVTGSYAYIAAGKDGLRIVDLTDPDDLFVTGAVEGIQADAVTVRGEYAYIAGGDSGLNIVNISDPAVPFVVGNRTTIEASDICLKDNYAYIADKASGIKIINISDSKNPSRSGTVNDVNSSVVSVSGNYLFSNDVSGVHIYDISNESNPVEISFFKLADITDIRINDIYCYILSEKTGLNIYDISDIENPVFLSDFSLASAVKIAVTSTHAYIADGYGGLKIINITNPLHPVIFDSIESGNTTAVDLLGEYVIIAEEKGLSAIQTFIQGISFVLNKIFLNGKISNISLFRNFAFVPAKEHGLKVLDVSSPSAPAELETAPGIEYSSIAGISGNRLILNTSSDTINIYDINTAHPEILSGSPAVVTLLSDIKNISINNNSAGEEILCVCTDGGGVSFIRNGELSGNIKSIDTRECLLVNETAYLSDHRAGLMIYDVSDLDNPEFLSSIEIQNADFMLIGENHLYLSGRKGIHIFDITIPTEPEETGFIKTSYAEKAVLRKKFLYVAEGYKGLKVYDISNPSNPQLVSLCDTVYASDLAVSDDYVFITDGTGINTVRVFIPDWLK